MITVKKMLMEPSWVMVDIAAFIVLAVLQLVSGQYSLQAPANHVALSGNVRVSYSMPDIGLSYPPNILLIDLSNDALRKSKSVPLAVTGGVTFECSYFDHAGTFQFQMQSTKNTSEILAYSNVIDVVWPDFEISVPTNLVASTRVFQVIAEVTSNLCENMRHNRYVIDMLLVYHGKNLSSNVHSAIPDGHGVVADSFPVGALIPNDIITVEFGCLSADRAGLYTVLLQSDFYQDTVARSSVFEVAKNANYGVSVSTGGIYPNCSGAGRVQPIMVRVTQPVCANEDDTVRVLGQTDSFSYTPSPASLVHIMERRIFDPDDSLQFFCSEFSEIYSGFCFRYVSLARSGAVDDQATVCIPLVYEGEPVDGHWSEWSQWGACTATCGQGVRHRSRSCTNPSPANGGAECTGNLLMTEFCSLGPCSTEPVPVTPTTLGPTCYCGCTLTAESGTIQSNPLFCENRTLFKWVIIAPDNYSIRLEFVSFYLAIHREYLRVRDGEDGDSPLLAYHTGVALPGPVSTSGNIMYMEYRVVRGGNLDQMGFSAVFTSQVADVVPPPPLPVGNTNESPVDVSQLNNTAILIAGIVLGVLVVLFSIVFAVHARCSRSYDYKPGMPHDDTAETQLRGMAMGTSSINSSSTHHSRPWGAAPIGRSTTSQSEQSNQSTSKRGWPDGDRSQLYVVHDESSKYHEASLSSSHRSTKEILPSIPSPYHEAELEKWTKKHGHKIAVPYCPADVSRGSAGELSTSKHSGRTDRNTTHLAMKSPEEFAMTGIHDSRTSMSSSKRNHMQETSHNTPQMQAIANVENTDNTSPYVNKDGQLTPLGLAVSKLNDNGMAFRIPEGAENPDEEKREHKERKHHRTHRHKDRSDLKSPDSMHSEGKKRRGVVHPEDVLEEEATPVEHERKLPVAPKMAFYSDDEPDFRPPPVQPEEEDMRAKTLPLEKSREKSSHSKGSSSRKNDPNHLRNGAMSPHRTSKEDGLGSGHSSTLRSDKSGSLDRHGRHDRSRKPPVPARHGQRSKKHGEKPVIPPRPDPHRYANHVTNSLESSKQKQDAASYSLPSDHLPSMSDYSGQMSVEPSPVRLPRPLNRKQNRAQLTQVFISDESLIRPQSGAESSRSGASHRQLPETPPYGFSPTRQQRPNTHRHQSDLSLSISQDEPEFDYYIPTVPGSFFENPYPMSPSERRINKISKPKSPSASLV